MYQFQQQRSVALGTDTTGNYVATVSGTSNEIVSGSGSESAGVLISLLMMSNRKRFSSHK